MIAAAANTRPHAAAGAVIVAAADALRTPRPVP
jgi:hypothetical protein